MFPIVKIVDDLPSGVNARNWPGLVKVRRGLQFRAAIVAQEAWESMHKMDPVKLFFRVFKRSKQDQREFEYMGHEVEVQAAALIYGVDANEYRLNEAKRMHGGYNNLFAHLSHKEIAMELRARSGKANRFVNEHLDKLKKFK